MPLHKELKYGTPEHDRLRDAIRARYRLSQNKMSQRVTPWKEAEELYLAYVPEKEAEAARKRAQKTGENTFSKVVLPYSYATLLSAHTYWASVFLGRTPVLQYTARHGESSQKVQAVEALIDYQLQVGAILVPLYLWLLDAGKYGMGVLGNYWSEEFVTVSEIVEEQDKYFGISLGKKKRRTVTQDVKGYCGNRLFNVRPQDFFPDPRVSLSNFQDGEFCARYVESSFSNLMRMGEGFFNLDALRDSRAGGAGNFSRVEGSQQIDLPDSTASGSDVAAYGGGSTKGNIPLIEMVWDLIPSTWGLGDSNRPEKWVMTLAHEDVLIGCRPQGLYHGKFPYFVQTYEMDGYSHTLRGMLEVIASLSRTLDWLFNSHMFNVRKSLNDQLIIDPSKIVMKDLLDGGPGKMIRLSPAAYGTDVRTAITQLQMVDVTRGAFADAEIIMQMIQRVVGVTDNIMGMVNTSGRKTATEVRTSTSFGINRLKTFAEYNSALAWSPMSQVMLQNSQQLMDDELKVKVAGDLLRGDPQFLSVTPEMITGFYDFVPVDGTMPVDRFAQANLWKEILMGLAQVPQIGATYDMAGIFSWMAQLAGLKNITQFKLAPDQLIQQQLQAGNLQPAAPGAVPNGIPGVSNIAGGSPAVQTRSGLTQ